MDSGNSGSMQSSSGGDDEFDSRPESISSFLNPPSNFGSIPQPPPSIPHHPPTFFNPSSSSHNIHSFSHLPRNPNLDLAWFGSIRPDTNYTDYCTLSSISTTPSSLIGGPQPPFQNTPYPGNTPRPPQPVESQTPAIRNPKKRTRASRRAPTTVLTTDTTNFRQMVQEFTGIPAAPFASSPYSRRLDLFSTGSSIRSGHNIDTMGQLYPLRPSAQNITYQQQTQPMNTLNMQQNPNPNPILNIQNLMQSQLTSRIPSLPDLGMRNLGSVSNDNMQNAGNYKLQSSSPSASDFQHEKGLDNVSSKGQGTADAWISPSD